MLTSTEIQILQKPRKRVKLDTVNLSEYNQFGGEAVQMNMEQQNINTIANIKNQMIKDSKVQDINGEVKGYGKIFQEVKKDPRGVRKIGDIGKKETKEIKEKVEVKSQNQAKIQVKQNKQSKDDIQIVKQQPETATKKSKSKQKKQMVQINSNWKQFLQNSAAQKQQQQPQQSSKTSQTVTPYSYISIDCQFVKSNQVECLARVSLVNEHNQQVYDSYVKPSQKITDFVTDVSGITFSHIKNAPSQQQVVQQIKKKMMNKIIIGHTTAKDIQVCGLTGWKGFKQIIDIAQAKVYSPGGKRVALKKLAYQELGRRIQEGWHSSVEDASVAMQLFIKNKAEILKEKNIGNNNTRVSSKKKQNK